MIGQYFKKLKLLLNMYVINHELLSSPLFITQDRSWNWSDSCVTSLKINNFIQIRILLSHKIRLIKMYR